MKRATIIITAALALLAACEKPNGDDPTPSEAVNPLIGTAWLCSSDDTMTYGILHMENRITFLTDSTGEQYSLTEFAYAFDTTYGFTYTFYTDVSGGELYYDGEHLPTYFRYFPESQTLTSGGSVFHLVEQ